MGLAEDVGGGRYRLAEGLEDTLRKMSERGDIIRTMQRELTRHELERTGVDRVIANSGDPLQSPVVGRVIHRGFTDELRDRHYLMVDGIDGRVHYLDVGRGDAIEPSPEGSIIRVSARTSGVRDANRTIAEVAAANDGRYSVDLHLRHDRSATEAFAEAHVRRLEAMRRADSSVRRHGRFALIEKSREFTLVPLRPVFAKQIGKQASGIMRADGVSWRLGRDKTGPEIS